MPGKPSRIVIARCDPASHQKHVRAKHALGFDPGVDVVRAKARLAARGRHAATGDAVRELILIAVERQTDVNPHHRLAFS